MSTTLPLIDPASDADTDVTIHARHWNPYRHHDFDVVAVRFPRELDDDEADTAAGLFGYSWAQHGAARHTGDIGDQPIVWLDLTTMVVSAPMSRRPEKTRTRAQATADLFGDFLAYLTEGSPVRKTGDRLVNPLANVDPGQVELFIA
ncbi:MAG: hypothetical protein L0H93_10490 [Nocardioides sp.]|nr:hypothetical protein [Nocardioides sp.]